MCCAPLPSEAKDTVSDARLRLLQVRTFRVAPSKAKLNEVSSRKMTQLQTDTLLEFQQMLEGLLPHIEVPKQEERLLPTVNIMDSNWDYICQILDVSILDCNSGHIWDYEITLAPLEKP